MLDGYINGVDISHHNGLVDFKALSAEGYKFCFLKASEGTGYIDPQFARGWELAPQAGLLTGAYHFFHPEQSAKDQAAHFLSTMGLQRAKDLPPVLDLEVSGGLRVSQIKAGALEWLSRIEQAVGKKPIVYSGRSFVEGLGDVEAFQSYPFWLAESPRQPKNWATPWVFWQHTDKNGFDLDIYRDDLASLVRLAGG